MTRIDMPEDGAGGRRDAGAPRLWPGGRRDAGARGSGAEEPAPRSLRPFLGFGVVVFLAILATAGYKSWRDLAAAHAREGELIGRIAAARARLEVLERRSELLRHDPSTLERLAREELGMVRPGDVVIVLPEDEPAAPPAVAETAPPRL